MTTFLLTFEHVPEPPSQAFNRQYNLRPYCFDGSKTSSPSDLEPTRTQCRSGLLVCFSQTFIYPHIPISHLICQPILHIMSLIITYISHLNNSYPSVVYSQPESKKPPYLSCQHEKSDDLANTTTWLTI